MQQDTQSRARVTSGNKIRFRAAWQWFAPQAYRRFLDTSPNTNNIRLSAALHPDMQPGLRG
jgi:hypothetical protein